MTIKILIVDDSAADRLLIQQMLGEYQVVTANDGLEAIQKIEKLWGCEKVTLINQLEQEEIPLYYCGEIYDYLYSYVVDCTGILSLFDLKRYRDGFLLSSPNKNNPKKTITTIIEDLKSMIEKGTI